MSDPMFPGAPQDPTVQQPATPPAAPPPPPPPAGSFGATPPVAPPAGSFDGGDGTQVFDLASASEGGGGGGRIPGRIAALGVGAALLTGGTVFALTSSGGGGPETPEEAAAAMFDAIANEDALGVLGALDPAERDAVREPLQQMAEELERLEVLDESFDLGNVAGFDFEFEGLTFEVDQVRDDLARVFVTEGEATVEVDGDQIAVGDFITDLLDEFDVDIDDLSTVETSEVEDTDEFFVARDTGDGWRISLGYTAAEAARDAFGGSVPDPGDGIAPRGADSPAEAVEQMVRAAADFDFEDMIAGMSSEMRPLQEYSEFYEDALVDAGRTARQEADVEINSIDLEADERGSEALVFVRGFDISVDADGMQFDIAVADGCVSVDGDLDELGLEGTPFESGDFCSDDLDDFSGDAFGDLEDELAEEGIDIPSFPPFNQVDVGIVAVNEDGSWFVSPLRTGLDFTVKGLQSVNREHLDLVVDLVNDLIESFENAFTFDEGIAFDDDFTFDDDFGAGIDPDFDFDFDLDSDFDIPEIPDFDEDFEFEAPSLETQFKFVFGNNVDCALAEFEALDPDLRDRIRAALESGDVENGDAGEFMLGLFDLCPPEFG